MKKFFSFDKSLLKVQTSGGTVTLSQLFIPVLIEYLLLNTMGTINTLMLSHYSDEAVAAVGTATQVMSMILIFYTVVSSGASIVINHNIGAGKKTAASDAAFASILVCSVLSIILGTTLHFFARPIMTMMNLTGNVLDYATTYFSIAIQFSCFRATMSSISAIFRSYGKPKYAVSVSIFDNVLLALIDYIVIYRPFETPLHGVSGIACAYAIAEFSSMVLIIILLIKVNLGLDFKHKNLHSLGIVKTILKVGIPGGIGTVSYSMSQVVSTSIIALLGTAAISTKVYVSNVVFYVYVFGMSLGNATSLMIGWLSGAGEYDHAYRLNQQNLKITVCSNAILSTCIFFFAKPLISMFSTDPQVLAMAQVLMFIDIFVEIGRGFNHIEEFSLRGAGDVVYPMIVAIISAWTMSILFSYILGIRLGLGLAGCWIAFGMDEMFRGINYLIRWRSRKWTTKTVAKKA